MASMVAGAEIPDLIPSCSVNEALQLLQQRFEWLQIAQQARMERQASYPPRQLSHRQQATDAQALVQLLLCPATTLPAARLLRPQLPAAVRTLVSKDVEHSTDDTHNHSTTVALVRILHIAPHLLDAALPWLSSHPPPWEGCIDHADVPPHGAMRPADVVLAALHALQRMPRLLQVWAPTLLPKLLGKQDGVLRWAALQCLGLYAGMSDAAMRCDVVLAIVTLPLVW